MSADLAIIIPTWDGAQVLDACLSSLSDHLAGASTEVIVFDNGSRDGSAELAEGYRERLPLRVVRSPVNLGYAAACNSAAAITDAPFLLLLNNDTRLTGGIEPALNYLRNHPEVAVCQGPLLTADGRYIDSAGSFMTQWGFLYHESMGQSADDLPSTRAVFSAKGAAMFVRREALGALGLFDREAFAYFEETDLCWRLQVAGWSVAFVRELPAVLHQSGFTTSRLPYAVWERHSFKNRLRAIIKNTELGTMSAMLPRHLFVCAAASADGLRRGSAQTLLSVGSAVVWNVVHLRDTLRLRRMVQARRRRRDSEVFATVTTQMRLRDFVQQRAAYARAHGEE